MRTQRHPTHVSETESDIHTVVAAPTEERHQPGAPVVAIVRTASARPPAPAMSRRMEPTAVMVRSPTPRVVAHPAPAIPVDPGPTTVAVRRPIHHHLRTPHPAVVVDADPGAVAVQVLGAVNVVTHILIGAGALQILVAPRIPVVPIVGARRARHLELGVGGGTACHHRVAGAQNLAAARREDLGFAATHGDLAGTVLAYLNAIHAAFGGPHGNAGSANLDLRVAVAQNPERHQSTRHLHLVAAILEFGKANLAHCRQANHVGPIELNFSPGPFTGGQPVFDRQRRIQRRRDPIASVATAHGNLTVNQADASNATAGTFVPVVVLRPRHTSQSNCYCQQAQQRRFHGKPPKRHVLSGAFEGPNTSR